MNYREACEERARLNSMLPRSQRQDMPTRDRVVRGRLRFAHDAGRTGPVDRERAEYLVFRGSRPQPAARMRVGDAILENDQPGAWHDFVCSETEYRRRIGPRILTDADKATFQRIENRLIAAARSAAAKVSRCEPDELPSRVEEWSAYARKAASDAIPVEGVHGCYVTEEPIRARECGGCPVLAEVEVLEAQDSPYTDGPAGPAPSMADQISEGVGRVLARIEAERVAAAARSVKK